MEARTNIADLALRVKKGDMLAAERLYENYAPGMLLISQRITNDRMTSEDILQESFVKSFTKIEKLKEPAKYGGWLKQMVINASITSVKKKKSWIEIDDRIDLEEEVEEEKIPKATTDAIHRAIKELPDRCRTVFSLYLIEGYTHAEVAETLDVSVSTSKSQYRYALKLLRSKIKTAVYE